MTRLGKFLLIIFLACIVGFLNSVGISDGLQLIGQWVLLIGGLLIVIAIIAKFWVWLTEDQY